MVSARFKPIGPSASLNLIGPSGPSGLLFTWATLRTNIYLFFFAKKRNIPAPDQNGPHAQYNMAGALMT